MGEIPPPTFADLQKCITPEQMLQTVGANLPCGTSKNEILVLSSTLLVRLSKHVVGLDNCHQFSPPATNRGVVVAASVLSSPPEYQDWSWDPLDTIVEALISNGSWDSTPATLDAAVEGTKAAAILARLCRDRTVATWDPIIQQWHAASDTLSSDLLPHQLSGLKWAFDCLQLAGAVSDPDLVVSLPSEIQVAYESLELPFRIRPGAMDYNGLDLTVPTLLEQVDFQLDTIKTTSNKVVPERRETAWEGDETVAPFEYSGKSMPRRSWSPLVKAVRDHLHEQTGVYYDGCLLNHYPDGGSGMRYHIDPDQGKLWDYCTAVVSVGATRKFAYREIPQNESSSSSSSPNNKPHVFTLMQGDCTEMFADCQTRFQHTVRTAETPNEESARASLVFKKTLNC